jgi:MarR family transcriptional regulator, organic hydroperoxide resistance regulator
MATSKRPPARTEANPEDGTKRPCPTGTSVGATDYLFHLLVVISRLRDAELNRRLQPLKLNIDRYRTLAEIAALGPCSMSTFASYSPLDRTTITRMIDQLVRAGWVSRFKPVEDRRQVHIALTDAGAATCERARDLVSKVNETLIDGIDEDMKAQTIAIQLMLAAKLEQRRGQFIDRQSASMLGLSDLPMVT